MLCIHQGNRTDMYLNIHTKWDYQTYQLSLVAKGTFSKGVRDNM